MYSKQFKFEEELKLREQIGNRLKQFRMSKSLNQTELAAKLGIEQYSLSRMEKGIVPVHIGHFLALANMKCDLHWLITGTGYKPDTSKEVLEKISALITQSS